MPCSKLVRTLALALLAAAPLTAKLRVVATLPVYADAARAIGGDHVNVISVAKDRQDPHFIQPTPWVVTRLARADVFLTTGLDLELWAGPLLEASANQRVFMNSVGYTDLSQGIPLLQVPLGNVTRQAGDVHMMGNPHFFYSPAGMLQVSQTIQEKFSELDPGHAQEYAAGGQEYRRKLRTAMARWEDALRPYQGEPIVPFHNSFPYFEDWSGLAVLGNIEDKPGINPSGGHLARLTVKMRKQNCRVILHEPWYNRRFSDSLARRTGARVVEFLSQPGKTSGADYVAMMDMNVAAIVAALEGDG
jgi:ABC-type Zn uptake system ZnuABC Zn-binding protein ZnuA